MIVTENLKRDFGELTAVENLNLNVSEGEIYGFLGPNGAGKTTTVRMLSCLISITEGKAFVAGNEVGKNNTEIRKNTGLVTENPGLYENLSAYMNLKFYASLYEVPYSIQKKQIEKYLDMLGLSERKNELVGKFSKGMKQKLAIAKALLHEPKVLFLDEPTASLDPEASKIVRDFISSLKEEKRTIFLCTHNLDEAEKICDRIGIFNKTLIEEGSPAELKSKLFGQKVVFYLKKINDDIISQLKSLNYINDVKISGNQLIVEIEKPKEKNPEIIRMIVNSGGEIVYVTKLKHSLEEVYFNLVKGKNNG
ncbi:multidrug ABC transporter ATP-binding protein [candidate division KSB1 bacterium]|nr:MAG: multidrug ABC transporter ATP-binding protein [candidate division KSB1 bacterium]